MIEEIEAEIRKVEGVEFIHISTNFTFEHDKKKDLPALSFKVYVKGGKKKQIARVIWEKKPMMLLSVGNTEVAVKDPFGIKWRIAFERML